MSSFKDHCPDAAKVKNGVRMPLFDKDGGITKDYVMVRWSWDDKVRAALDVIKREGQKRIIQIKPGMDAKTKKAAEESNENVEKELIAEGRVSQVAGWSFEEKLTKANVQAFLQSRPDVAERIDTTSATNKLFFTDSGKSS